MLALGCNPVGVKPVEEDTEVACRAGERCSIKHTWLSTTAPLDLLFVIDNSGSMADARAKLAAGLDALVDELVQSNVDLDLHVAFTTTDMGNPRYPDSDPERGALVLSSCRDRVAAGGFLFAGVDPPLDGAAACTARCDLTDADLVIRPTTTWGDPEAKRRAASSTSSSPGPDADARRRPVGALRRRRLEPRVPNICKAPLQAGMTTRVNCQLSALPVLDCPDL